MLKALSDVATESEASNRDNEIRCDLAARLAQLGFMKTKGGRRRVPGAAGGRRTQLCDIADALALGKVESWVRLRLHPGFTE